MSTIIIVDCLDIITVLSLIALNVFIIPSFSRQTFTENLPVPSTLLGAGERFCSCPQIFHRSVVAVMPAWRELQGNTTAGSRKAFKRRHLIFFKDEFAGWGREGREPHRHSSLREWPGKG